jgi:hypothetical protein
MLLVFFFEMMLLVLLLFYTSSIHLSGSYIAEMVQEMNVPTPSVVPNSGITMLHAVHLYRIPSYQHLEPCSPQREPTSKESYCQIVLSMMSIYAFIIPSSKWNELMVPRPRP